MSEEPAIDRRREDGRRQDGRREDGRRPLHLVGIDPGEETGLAVYDLRAASLVVCESGRFFDVQERLGAWAFPPVMYDLTASLGDLGAWRVAAVVLEDHRHAPLYARHDRKRGRRRDAIARHVGRVDRDVALWIEWLRRRGHVVLGREPIRGAAWCKETLAQLTGWTKEEHGDTNQHARDAARLVWGWTEPELRLWLQQAADGEHVPMIRR